jgi:hypothetical protein
VKCVRPHTRVEGHASTHHSDGIQEIAKHVSGVVLQAMYDFVANPATDLFARIPPHGDGQTILREALLIADHNAYHLGQLVVVRRALGAWSGE